MLPEKQFPEPFISVNLREVFKYLLEGLNPANTSEVKGTRSNQLKTGIYNLFNDFLKVELPNMTT